MSDFSSTRRRFLKTMVKSGASAAALSAFAGCRSMRSSQQQKQTPEAWAQAARILQQIQPPHFPDRNFPIDEFGARSDDKRNTTEAFKKAIAACASAGGGRVVVPEGRYLTGPIHLRSNVNLHITADATIAFSRDPDDYLPAVYTRWGGVEAMNYSPLIYAFEQENVAVTGSGTLDGQADHRHWWPWKGKKKYGWTEGAPNQHNARQRLFALAEKGVPVRERVFGNGDYLRPQFIQPYRCRNVLIEGITLHRAPQWNINPVLCHNVTVRNVHIASHGPNNDGCNPCCSRNVLIEDCYFDTGDDCIAIKAGRNADGRRVDTPSENVVVRGCHMKDGHGGVVVGSATTGGVRNIFAENCRMDSPNLYHILRIKTNSLRGGYVKNVNLRNIDVGEVAWAAIQINFFYEEGNAGSYSPQVEAIDVRNVTCQSCNRVVKLRGYEDDPIRNVQLTNCRFMDAKNESVIENVRDFMLDEVHVNGRRVRNPARLRR